MYSKRVHKILYSFIYLVFLETELFLVSKFSRGWKFIHLTTITVCILTVLMYFFLMHVTWFTAFIWRRNNSANLLGFESALLTCCCHFFLALPNNLKAICLLKESDTIPLHSSSLLNFFFHFFPH